MAALSGVFDPRRERRDGSRAGAFLPVELLSHDWECHSVELIEISARGFRALHDQRFTAGENVRIAVPGLGPVDARIKWCDGQAFGAEFVERADLRLLFLGGPVARRSTWLERLAA